MNERNFYTPIFVCSIMLTLFLNFTSCKNETKKTATSAPLFFELSLAQWSFHRTFREGGVSPYEFAERANDLGFKEFESAKRTLVGIEIAHMIKKEQLISNRKLVFKSFLSLAA